MPRSACPTVHWVPIARCARAGDGGTAAKPAVASRISTLRGALWTRTGVPTDTHVGAPTARRSGVSRSATSSSGGHEFRACPVQVPQFGCPGSREFRACPVRGVSSSGGARGEFRACPVRVIQFGCHRVRGGTSFVRVQFGGCPRVSCVSSSGGAGEFRACPVRVHSSGASRVSSVRVQFGCIHVRVQFGCIHQFGCIQFGCSSGAPGVRGVGGCPVPVQFGCPGARFGFPVRAPARVPGSGIPQFGCSGSSGIRRMSGAVVPPCAFAGGGSP